jgi:Flp pilus assembly protein TadG
MTATRRLRGLAAIDRFRRGEGASSAVEFSLLATTLLLLFAGLIDFIQISTITRDIERTSTQIGNLIASCARSSDQSCTTNTMNAYMARQANTLIRYSQNQPTVSMAQISESNNALKICAGNMTYLESDVSSSALALMSDKDNAIVVVIQIKYVAMFPLISRMYTGTTGTTIRGWTTTVHSSGSSVC